MYQEAAWVVEREVVPEGRSAELKPEESRRLTDAFTRAGEYNNAYRYALASGDKASFAIQHAKQCLAEAQQRGDDKLVGVGLEWFDTGLKHFSETLGYVGAAHRAEEILQYLVGEQWYVQAIDFGKGVGFSLDELQKRIPLQPALEHYEKDLRFRECAALSGLHYDGARKRMYHALADLE